METKLPKRKHPRLKDYDYSTAGAYFVTICTHNKRCLLSRIVGRGLAPAEVYDVECSQFGRIAEEELLLLEQRYPFLRVDQFVIMPNHIHAVLILRDEAAGASPRPTVMDIVCVYKSLTTRACRQIGLEGKLFQTSFYEHVIRGEGDYAQIAQYICENPQKWKLDKLHVKE